MDENAKADATDGRGFSGSMDFRCPLSDNRLWSGKSRPANQFYTLAA